MTAEKQGYMVFYDTGGDGLASCSWGLWICWGEEELTEEITRVLYEIEEEGEDRSGDIVITRVCDSIGIRVSREEIITDTIKVALEGV